MRRCYCVVGVHVFVCCGIHRYTSTPIVRSILNGAEYQGAATRSSRDAAYLQRYACEILTLRLQ
eukprot:COSAG05_NODE_1621_length_4386_cov_3.207371_1_plen_63_part_10